MTVTAGPVEPALRTLRLGTRRSALALAQSGAVAARLRGHGLSVDLVEIATAADRSSAPVEQLGTGVFVTALRRQLLDGEIDLAVHSLKDLPTAPADGLVVAAVPAREDPRDALVARDGLTLGELPAGATIGTGAPRRIAQLRALGLGLDVVPIRGNVDSRVGRVADGDIDAVVVASAGLRRLDRVDLATELLDPVQMLPAPGQGALAIECRATEPTFVDTLRGLLDDESTRHCVLAERTVLADLEAGCTAPVGALADLALGEDEESEIYLRAVVASSDGSRVVRLSATGVFGDAERIGHQLAADLLDAGAADLIGENP